MTLLSLPRVRGMTEKGYQSTIFKPRNATPPRTECELNHVSKCQALSTTKSKAKRAFLKGNSQDKLLHDNRCNWVQ